MERLRCPELEGLVMDARDAVRRLVPRDGVIATGGMSGTAVPKEFPKALSQYVEEVGDFSLTLLTGSATTPTYEEHVGKLRGIVRRYPYLSGGTHRRMANDGSLRFFDYGLNKFNKLVRRGFFGEIYVAVIEVTGVTGDCSIIPSTSLDASLSFIQAAKKVVLELNAAKPALEGLHDVYVPADGDFIPLKRVTDRVGESVIKIPKSKIGAIVLTDEGDAASGAYQAPSATGAKIADNILKFLGEEAGQGFTRRLVEGGNLVIQPGAGPLSSSLADKARDLGHEFSVWAETVPVKWALVGEPIKGLSTSALYILPGEDKYMDEFLGEFKGLLGKVVVRGQEVSNNPELIQRLNVISIQQALEVDIYGNVNVSHIGGDIYNGVGGSVDFAPNAYLLVVALPSTAGNGEISRIAPVASHVDIPEHYVDVVITEQGIADLRGLSPLERANAIIGNCAHPKFKDGLLKYYEAIKGRGHEPYDPELARLFLGE